MTGLRLLTLLSALMLIALSSCSVGRAEQTLPLELAEILPMSADELLKLADQQADFLAPATPVLVEEDQTTYDAEPEVDHAALAEVNQEMKSEAQVEQEVEQQAEAAAEADNTPALPELPPVPAITDTTAVTAPGAATPAAANSTDEGEKPVLPMESASRRLKRHHHEIRDLERKMQEQSDQFQQYTADPTPTLRGKPISSGSNYWEGKIDQLKSSSVEVLSDTAADLTQTDARCVICQFVVQQAMGILSGKPLTSGGATSGGKRAAAAADAAAASPAASTEPAGESAAAFLEFDEHMDELEELEESEDPFEFLELDASLGVFSESGLDAVLAAEMESTVALNSAMENFLSASESAMEHSATQALRSHYRRPYMGPNLRNVNAVSYPRQLNDFGFEENSRNRQADVLAFRPRQARFARGDIEAAQAKWDETHATYQKLYNGVYRAFESLCTKRMPLAYVGYCQEMMRDYRYIAQGIQYGDRAQSICMNGNWCDRKSYIRHAVHAYFVRAPGDN